MADALSYVLIGGTDTNPIQDNLQTGEMDVAKNHNNETPLLQVRCLATTYVIGDSDNLQKAAENAFIFEWCLQNFTTDLFCQQSDSHVGKSEAEYTVQKSNSSPKSLILTVPFRN